MVQLILEKIVSSNFRNLENETVEFKKSINCIFGNNGNGKSNLLELIQVLLHKKSFRKNASFPQYLSMNCEYPQIIISVLFKKDLEKQSYSLKIEDNNFSYSKNGKITKDKINLSSVFINPFDSFAFHNNSKDRRHWFDKHISILDKDYKRALNRYNTALRFRNTLILKKPVKFRDQIKAIDSELAENSYFILEKRKKFIEQIKQYCIDTFKVIFDQDHLLEIKIDSKLLNLSKESIYKFYKKNTDDDILNGRTRYGIHKDDYLLLFDGLNSFDYCSLGQQKMSYLSLIFAYIELFRYKVGSFPIILIDDISGELDTLRWGRLIYYLDQMKFQVLITTANEKFKEELKKIKDVNLIHVDQGSISQI